MTSYSHNILWNIDSMFKSKNKPLHNFKRAKENGKVRSLSLPASSQVFITRLGIFIKWFSHHVNSSFIYSDKDENQVCTRSFCQVNRLPGTISGPIQEGMRQRSRSFSWKCEHLAQICGDSKGSLICYCRSVSKWETEKILEVSTVLNVTHHSYSWLCPSYPHS